MQKKKEPYFQFQDEVQGPPVGNDLQQVQEDPAEGDSTVEKSREGASAENKKETLPAGGFSR